MCQSRISCSTLSNPLSAELVSTVKRDGYGNVYRSRKILILLPGLYKVAFGNRMAAGEAQEDIPWVVVKELITCEHGPY